MKLLKLSIEIYHKANHLQTFMLSYVMFIWLIDWLTSTLSLWWNFTLWVTWSFGSGSEVILSHFSPCFFNFEVVPILFAVRGGGSDLKCGIFHTLHHHPTLQDLQSFFHALLSSDLNMLETLYLEPFWLWTDQNPLAWSGAIEVKVAIFQRQKKIPMLKVETLTSSISAVSESIFQKSCSNFPEFFKTNFCN